MPLTISWATRRRPGRRGRSAADAFLASAEDTLAPKLTYSKHNLRDLVAAPDAYPAHLTLFLDSFDLTTVAASPINDRRSFFGSSLIIEPAVVFRRSDQLLDPQWDEYIVADPDSADTFIATYAAAERATARLLGADNGSFVPVVLLPARPGQALRPRCRPQEFRLGGCHRPGF